MGKRGSWFAALKRVFNPSSRDKPVDGSEKKTTKEKKRKGLGNLRHGESNSFLPLFREPSSIEKILGDAEREQHKILVRPPTPVDMPQSQPLPPPPPPPPSLPPRVASSTVAPPRVASPTLAPPRVASPTVAPPRVASSSAAPPRVASSAAAPPRVVHHHRPEPTLKNHHASATKIQTAYRGYMARRSFRALKGLVRLQGVVRGQNVKRQTMNAMKYMQLLVRVQTQIQSRRTHMLENQMLPSPPPYKNEKDLESNFGKWTLSQPASDAGNPEDWDDSILTKEEVDSRLQRKVEAVIKKERAMAYAYSNQLWRASPKPAPSVATSEIQSARFPWWWNWLDRQLPPLPPPATRSPFETQSTKNAPLTPTRPSIDKKPSSRPQTSTSRRETYAFDNSELFTPKSFKSAIPIRSKPRTSRANSTFDMHSRDDDSLTSCPAFSVPSYMAPTVSAKAKVRANSNPKERSSPSTPSGDSRRRLSFPLTPSIGSFKWNKGSLFSGKDSTSQRISERNQSVQSLGNLSIDSTTSLPAAVGRKAFNRFV